MTPTKLRRRTDYDTTEPSLRALVVEDNPEYRGFISALVARHGFATFECADGEDALAALEERTFDLFVVDCEMPKVSGLELIAAIRSQERHAESYTVMLTGRDDVDTKLSALRLGYDDFLSKHSTELEIAAKLSVARRIVSRQRRLDNAVRELYGLATRDELTGLFNRRYFFAEAERMLAEKIPINLVLFDLDDFKIVNDSLGHLAGDRILRDLGGIFARKTRQQDLVARYGGDEFVMLVRNAAPAEVESFASRVAAHIMETEWSFESSILRVGVTTGMACSAFVDAPTVSRLLSACDRDLYKNKWLRKNPDTDPSRYEYESAREGRVVELIRRPDDLRDQDEPGMSDSPR
jgi:diguanylate cyclase (GGDEF)-like protein